MNTQSVAVPQTDAPPIRARRWPWVLGVLAISLVGLFLLTQRYNIDRNFFLRPILSALISAQNNQTYARVIGSAAPDFALETVTGDPVTLSQFQGQPVVLVFWASWCQFCQRELPELQTLWEEHQDEVIFLAVNREEEKATIQQFQQDYPTISFPLLVDPEASVWAQYEAKGAQVIPTTYFIDADGNIQEYVRGAQGLEEQRLALAQILE
ncbi:TlpA family protein disulfide reductase [Chloroflexi bacterium TSY]|nr:TlpA family protein disulfide reductase [Chloroflexi bacterium TSY]